MTAAQLHPAVAHHVVNTLGWTSLRPLQRAAIGPVHEGCHLLLLAPTAGGKTEAAVLPLLSRMLTERWDGLSVLYLCPLRALLNDLHPRLDRYAGLVGRRAGLWHGDVGEGARAGVRAEPPDLLLTTPESLEAILVSTRTDHRALFGRVRAVVVDELHAFAGDDRGWHLLAVLQRVQRLAGRELQRIGLSATVGEPEGLLAWLTRACQGPRQVLAPPAPAGATPDLTVDYVGTLHNAATVVSRLHRGEKRLVFVDSRARAEELAAALREREVTTFVSHGSLGREERRAAERAFAEARNCVVVATSTLELGIDVGDLDRVIQLDAPASVASFLQRLGRSGRRAGAVRNLLFLATSEEALLQSLGLLALFEAGYVEPVCPPPLPFHLVAQQTLALALQEGGVGRHLWREWFGEPFVFGSEVLAQAGTVVGHLVEAGLLFCDQGLLSVGAEGEVRFGRRHFAELTSVFLSPPTLRVVAGRAELGEVPARIFDLAHEGVPVLLLAGHSWAVTGVDWHRRVVHVEPAEDCGRARWFGDARPLRAELCHAMRDVLSGHDVTAAALSRRASERLAILRERFGWLGGKGTVVVRDQRGATTWWTFAGLLANLRLAEAVAHLRSGTRQRDNLAIRLADGVTATDVRHALAATDLSRPSLSSSVAADAVDRLKFAECLPPALARQVVGSRLYDADGVDQVLHAPVREHRTDGY